jgi:hypothetical protein
MADKKDEAKKPDGNELKPGDVNKQGATAPDPKKSVTMQPGPTHAAATNPNTATTVTGAPLSATDPVAAAPNQRPGTTDSEDGTRTATGVSPDAKNDPPQEKFVTPEVQKPVLRITLAPTKAYRFTPKVPGATFWTGGYSVNAGDVVFLTETQALNFRDRFEAIDDSGFTVNDVPPYHPNQDNEKLARGKR